MAEALSFIAIGFLTGNLFMVDGWFGASNPQVELWKAPRVRGMLYVFGGAFTVGIAKTHGFDVSGWALLAYFASTVLTIAAWLFVAFPLLARRRTRHLREELGISPYHLTESAHVTWVRLILDGLRSYVTDYDALKASLVASTSLELAARVVRFFEQFRLLVAEIKPQEDGADRVEALRANAEMIIEWFLLDFFENASPPNRCLKHYRAGIYVRSHTGPTLHLYAEVCPPTDGDGLPRDVPATGSLPGLALQGTGRTVCYPRDFPAGSGSPFGPSSIASAIHVDGACQAALVVQSLAQERPCMEDFHGGLMNTYVRYLEEYIAAHEVATDVLRQAATPEGLAASPS